MGTYSTPGWGQMISELDLSPHREAGLLTHVSEEFIFAARK
jgi:hypothetical protein